MYAVETAPEIGFGYSYYAHMVPPMKPDHTLMLGYGEGVVADLMRKIHGPCKITAVDLEGYQKPDAYREYDMKVMDAFEFIRDCTDSLIKKRFDYIAVDLWIENYVDRPDVVQHIYFPEYAKRLKEMCTNKLCINQTASEFEYLRPYYQAGFKYDRFVDVYGNRVSWWSVE